MVSGAYSVRADLVNFVRAGADWSAGIGAAAALGNQIKLNMNLVID